MTSTATPSSPSVGTTGIVLFAHGSRDPLWRLPMDAVAQRITALNPAARVVCAFLELTTPDLPSAVAELVADGMQRITVVPLFLGVGKHAREDLPLLMAELHTAHPSVTFTLQAAVGEDPRLTDLLARIALD